MENDSSLRCEDVSAQIEAALTQNIDVGVLLPTAVPCELTSESFDPRVPPADVTYLLDAFQNACGLQAQCGGPPPTPPRDVPVGPR